MKNKKLVILLIAIVLVISIPYFIFNNESIELTDTIRSKYKVDFIETKRGSVSYELKGEKSAPLIVMVHGFSSPMFTWDPLFQMFVDSGFQVLRYDLFGRGMSDRPNTKYNQKLFRDQLTGLLNKLNIHKKFHIMGLSMGGAIAVDFANHFPGKINTMVLLDPAGFPVNIPLKAKLIRLPLIGDYLINVLGDKILLKAIANNFHNSNFTLAFTQRYKKQMKYKGFKRAMLSTLRNMPLGEMKDQYVDLGKKKIPTLLFWGENDKVISVKNHILIKEAISHIQFKLINNAGHLPGYEKPKLVLKYTRAFFQDHLRKTLPCLKKCSLTF